MSEFCRRCGDKSELMRLRMEDQVKHLMFYVTLPLCEKCGWELRDQIRDVVRSFQTGPEEVNKNDEADEGCGFEDFEVT